MVRTNSVCARVLFTSFEIKARSLQMKIAVLSLMLIFVLLRVEAETLRHLSAMYCPLVPPPRSTIAAAFSPDGRTLASTQ